jgi:molybdenum cofactor synthesis domain-containing protein
MGGRATRVGIVTVGDELLAGDTTNTNAAWLGRQLTDRGARVERVTVVPDRTDDIVAVVRDYRDAYDAVVVTGGLGPTPDDVTMTAVATAVGRDLDPSAAVRDRLGDRGYAADDLAPGTAAVPEGARVLHNETGVAPGCVVDDVYVLPGVPGEMRAMFESVADEFGGPTTHEWVVETTEPESELLDRIELARDRFGVAVGSYPGDRVRLAVRGGDPEAVAAAADWLRSRVERG